MNKNLFKLFAKKTPDPTSNPPLKVKRGIRFKLLVTTLSLVISVLATFAATQIVLQKNVAEETLQSRIELINQLLFQLGKSVSKLLALQIENDIATNNFNDINILVEDTIKESIALKYAILTDLNGKAYVHTAKPELQQQLLTSERDIFAIQQQHSTIREYPEDKVVEYIKPIDFGKPWGVLRLGYSLNELQNEIARSRHEMAQRTQNTLTASVAIAIIFITFTSIIIFIISDTISKPLFRLTKFSQELGKGAYQQAIDNYLQGKNIKRYNEIGILSSSLINMAKEIKVSHDQLESSNVSLEKLNAQQVILIEKLQQNEEQLQHTLATESKLRAIASQFVPNEFLALLDCNSLLDIRLGLTKQQTMSVLFCDIRDFTSLSECMTPVENFKFISSYLLQMEPAISKNGGIIDKYIGDAIMALFNGSADDAVRAGIAMLKQLVVYNGYRHNCGYRPIKIGIGINTGSLILGTVGTEKRMDGTVISDSVNLSARLESITKNYGTPLLISHHTYKSLQNPENYAIRMIDKVTVKGKEELVTVYEVFDGDPEPIKQVKLSTLAQFDNAIAAYGGKRFDEARSLFRQCLSANPQDRVCQIYLDRCNTEDSNETV